MDYADLVEALKENDSSRVNEHLNTLIPRLHRFLTIHMNASRQDAEDCAQETLLLTLEAINEDRIKNPERILSYMLTSCRNNYLKMVSKDKEQNYEEVPEEQHHQPGQLKAMLDEERKSLLEWCMEQLKDEYKKFMEYWFTDPGMEAEKVADKFNLSLSNTWTRKHRIIKQLNECYQKKSEL